MDPSKEPVRKAEEQPAAGWRRRAYIVIFEADTPAGKAFDVALLVAIVASVLAVMLESVGHIERDFGTSLRALEWLFTIVFSVEYIARVLVVGRPLRYVFSFLGVVDFLAVIPTYISLFFIGTQYLLVIRIIRLLRVFRIFKLARHVRETRVLLDALKAARPKITVFLGVVLTIVIIMGTTLYLVEGAAHGFTSIPKSIYWAIVTLTTVGYGDIAPQTFIGQALSSLIMITGYSIIAVPTGIVSMELGRAQVRAEEVTTFACCQCSAEGHDADAEFCKFCGAALETRSP